MIQLQISGMTCNNCVKHAEQALRDVKGVERVEVQLEPGRAEVYGNPNLNDLIAALDEEGYVASPIA